MEATSIGKFPRADVSSTWYDRDIGPTARCKPQILGENFDVPQHDLAQVAEPRTSEECAQACCDHPKCGGAIFVPISNVTNGGCTKGKPCCLMKTSVTSVSVLYKRKTVEDDSVLWAIAGRSQHDEKLNFLSATLGSHMVLQRAPQRAVIWGHTTPGVNVTTTMTPSDAEVCSRAQGNCTTITFVTIAGVDGTWRQHLPPMPASKVAYNFAFESSNSNSEKATLEDVLFGDVFICGGQSNMAMGMTAVANASLEMQEANNFPTIRIFSAGHNRSFTPLHDLQNVREPWQIASSRTIASSRETFSSFSAVCWFFGKEISRKLSPTGNVPIGLISNNWRGTRIEFWTPAESFSRCNRSETDGPMYNAMIRPYAIGPMSISGFAWYQGEQNTADAASAQQYSCLFPEMIKGWRKALNAQDAYFGFIQLSTFCRLPPIDSLPQMREAQMAALKLPNVGYATNADHGQGCDIHPQAKQYAGKRLATSALALHYKMQAPWRSPTYKSATQLFSSGSNSSVTLIVSLNDVSTSGLHIVHPFNSLWTDCKASIPLNQTYNISMSEQCAWAQLQISKMGWVNATVDVESNGRSVVFTAKLPDPFDGSAAILASTYGWGPIPMMSIYDKETGLPVLPWKHEVDERLVA